MRQVRLSLVGVTLAVLATAACALRSPSIADLQVQPGPLLQPERERRRPRHELVGCAARAVQGVQIGDSSGEITVVSDNRRVPPRGAKVRVKGKVTEFGTFGGRSVGLHLREENLRVLRRD